MSKPFNIAVQIEVKNHDNKLKRLLYIIHKTFQSKLS